MPKKERANVATIRLGEVIRRLRLERGWTLVTLAKRSGMNATYLGIMEKGGNMLSLESLYELAHAFNVEPWEILREFEDPSQPATPKKVE
ncbi:MAG TPA: helix-turn-helix transcriptional regulator [Thermoanaerobaculia bacterium]